MKQQARLFSVFSVACVLHACGGNGGLPSQIVSPPPISAPAEPFARLPNQGVSAETPVAAGCTGGAVSGQNYPNAEVEPFAAVHPNNPNIIASAWQQDRWSNGGARALVAAVSEDGGATWVRQLMPFSRCGGALPGSAGDDERVSDPWVDIGPTGIIYAMGLSFSGESMAPGSSSTLIASRSLDNGKTWAAPRIILRDGADYFNDKNALTADPTDARYVYTVWDRLDTSNRGPTLFSRSTDSGATWETARTIYAPTVRNGVSQTLGNRIVVLPDGSLINMFTQIDTVNNLSTSFIAIIRSFDKGVSWSAPIRVADIQAVGAITPQTGTGVRDGAGIAQIAAGQAGNVWITWQDARFSGGLRDAIVISRSRDGGATWSSPVAISRNFNVPAFTPSIAVSADGNIGVSHFDFRFDTARANTTLTSAWLLSSRDGITWNETLIWSPFDLNQAAVARGLFLGDYQGLVATGSSFLPVLAMSSQDTNNRSDIFALKITPSPLAGLVKQAQRKETLDEKPLSEKEFSTARHAAIVNTMERRMPGWAHRLSLPDASH